MKYRKFGNSGIEVSTLGFGAMRLPTIGEGDKTHVDLEKSVPMLNKGIDLGINYIDTAWGYLNNKDLHTVDDQLDHLLASLYKLSR